MASVLGRRMGAVARELTKLHEEVVRGPLADLAQTFAARELKGEVVILAGPPAADAASDDVIREKLAAALAAVSLRDAAKAVADALGVPKSRVYDVGLAMKQDKA
jgi:16S rRNA (cytidine1402-2'-O)-methyltransferase